MRLSRAFLERTGARRAVARERAWCRPAPFACSALATILLLAAAAAAQDFTIVALPDTQHYADDNPAIFDAQAQWIVDERASRNIVLAPHLGDCVQDGDLDITQWQAADAAMAILENPGTTGLPDGVPYAIAVGNRDQSPFGDPGPGTSLYYNQFFGSSRFASRGYYGGHYGTDNDNSYVLFSASGMDFIVIFFEYDTNQDPAVVAWADALLATHSNRRAILAAHYALNTGDPAAFSNQGLALYDGLKHHPNLFLILGGHKNGEGKRVDMYQGNTVHSVLADYQDRPNGGDGWLRVMEFSPANDEIRVKTYSPWLDQWETDADSEFTLAYDMDVTCTSAAQCDDGIACTADACVANVCQNTPSCPAGSLCDTGSGVCEVPPPFTAFNDLAWDSAQMSTNITTITSPTGGSGLASSGALVDYATGTPTDVTLTVLGGSFNGTTNAQHGVDYIPGSDGEALFAGRIDPHGIITYVNAPSSPLTLQLSGLVPGAVYEVAYYTHRDRYDWERGQEVTLTGAASFVNASSTGIDDLGNPLYTGPSDASIRMPADNDAGWVVHFTDVDPGSDGSVALEVEFDGDPGSEYRGKYANALRVRHRPTCSLAADCNDGNVCTDDSCVAGICTYSDNTASCDDGSVCTTVDTCGDGYCQGSVPLVCDNGLFCDGGETCDPALGCQAGTPPSLDDGISCTNDTCDEVNDVVVNAPDAGLCDNGLFCDGAEVCDPALDCQPGTPPSLDDAVACTDDACDEVGDVVTHTPNDGLCDDSLWCNGAETCNATLDCQPGTPPSLDDGVVCTIDTCDEVGDVAVHTPSDPLCDDGLWCTGSETCHATLDCQAGTPPPLDDGVGCTDDACDEVADVVTHVPNDALCDDTLWCNGSETCHATLDCQAGTPPPLDDFVGCTFDSCDEVGDVAVHTPDDLVCDDADPGTNDTCDPVLDCQNDPIPPVPTADSWAQLLIAAMLAAAGATALRHRREGGRT
jgi:hypothetical protein